MSNKFNRREFLELTGLSAAGLCFSPFLAGCSSGEQPSVPFGIWEEMMTALKQSPDHLPGRRSALIAAKDPSKMVEFVRDSFQIIPNENNFLRYINHVQGFGKQSAMRCGWATVREKAEILKDMLTEAGFEAKVILERTEVTEEDVKNIVFRSYRQEFAPPITKRQLRKWRNALGAAESNGRVTEITDIEERSKTLADTLYQAIMDEETEDRKKTTFHTSANEIPSVMYMDEGIEKYGHVFDPEVAAGDLHPTNKDKKFKVDESVKEFKDEEISIVIKYAKIDGESYSKMQELVSGTWKLSELAGNTVHLLFMNNMDYRQQVASTVSDITSFTPCLSFQNVNADTVYMEERSVVGEPIDLSGDPIFNEALENQSAEPSPNGKKVVDVQFRAVPKIFPKVQLEVYPKDAQGNWVEGLTVGNFILKDNGKPVPGLLRKNEIAPKFLILYDTSLSMPNEYRNPEQLQHFADRLHGEIRSIFPKASIKTQKTGSEIFTSLLRAKQSDADVILYATDGDNNDSYNAAYKDIYDTGPVAIILNVTRKGSQNDTIKFRELRENVDFTEISATDQEATIVAITEAVKDLEFTPYVLTYQSFDEKEEHTINIEIVGTSISAKQTFRFPESIENNIGQRIYSVSLEIFRNNRRVVQRTLAGWNSFLEPFKPHRKYIEDVHELFLGNVILTFEREAPPLSVRLTDYLQTLLSHKAWFEAQQNDDIDTAIEKLDEGVMSYPTQMLTMMQPLSNPVTDTSITFVTGFRAGVLKFKPGYYKTTTELSFDYLPTNNFASIHRDGMVRPAFYLNLKNSLQLSLLESEAFDHSALKDLDGKPLVLFKDINSDQELRARAVERMPQLMHALYYVQSAFMDESLQSDSYIMVNRSTGEAYGMLINGMGGGTNSVEMQLLAIQNTVREYQKVLSVVNLVAMASGTGLAVGIVSAYSLTLVKLYAFASQALVLMDASALNDQVREALKELACNVYKEILYTTIGKAGKVGSVASSGMGGIENLIGAMGGDYSFVSCPGM